MANSDSQQEPDVWDVLEAQVQTDLEQYKRELKEIALVQEQSQLEVSKLTQRNASITAHLQQVQSQFDTLPRADIRMAYDSALDAQQRLFVMRGQVEKLQSDQTHLNNHIAFMESVLEALESGAPGRMTSSGGSTTGRAIEMIVQAQESERQRLSRRMHDGPAQALSNFILQTEIAMRLFEIDQEKAKEELETLKVAATGTFRQVRDFIFELRPMMLDDLGLIPTLKRYVDALKEQTNIDMHLSLSGRERRIEPYQEVMVFRATQELLNNASQHSQASVVKLQIDMGDGDIRVTVDDDGKGLEEGVLDESIGMGLKIIRDRVEMLGGTMDIDSVINQGTRVSFQLPTSEHIVID